MFSRHTIGILGGTFDPIHFGHLRAALEVKQALDIDELRLMPSDIPPHRKMPIASAPHRLEMITLAVHNTELLCDPREIKRKGISYTVDTLASIRQEFPESAIHLVLGCDAFASLPTWHDWEKILILANIIVMHRKSSSLPEEGEIGEILKKHQLKPNEHIHSFLAGRILPQTVTILNISGSLIRELIQQGKSPRFLLPEPVLTYIQHHALYGYNEALSVNRSVDSVDTSNSVDTSRGE